MQFAGTNYWAVLVAAVASWLFGALWYGLLSKQWITAQGRTLEEFKAGSARSPLPFVVSFVAQLVMAWILAGLMGHIFAKPLYTLKNGALSGAFVWAGFVGTVLATGYAYQQRKLALLLIDGGYWLFVLLIEGAVIGYFGVK